MKWTKIFLACGLLLLFAGQFAETLQTLNPSPGVAQAEEQPLLDYLYLNKSQIMAGGSGCYPFRARGPCYLVAQIEGPGDPNGADIAPVLIEGMEGGTLQYPCTTGLNAIPITFPPTLGTFNLTINPEKRGYFRSLAIQPFALAVHEVNLSVYSTGYQIPFNGSGPIAIIIWSFMNLSNLELVLDGIPLKQASPPSEFDLPCYAVASALTQDEGLVFEVLIECGPHLLTLGGTGDCTIVISNGESDFDNDGLCDSQEILLNDRLRELDPILPNCWGIQYGESITEGEYFGFFDDQQDFWKKEMQEFVIPADFEVTKGSGCDAWLEVAEGFITNITIDGSSDPMTGISMGGHIGRGDSLIDFPDASGQIQRFREDQLMCLDRHYLGKLNPGPHQIAYQVLWDPLTPSDISIQIQNHFVVMLSTQTTEFEERGSDSDGIPDDMDLSPSDFVRWEKDTLTQLAIPCNPSADEDLQIRFQVVRPPAGIDRTTNQSLDWHPEENTHRQVQILPAMILYGPATSPEARQQGKFWSNLDQLATFLNGSVKWPVHTYNLVEFDKNGNRYAVTGLAGDCDPLPQGDAFAAQMLVLPQMAEKVMEYEVSIPSNHPCIQNDGVVNLRYRFAYALVSQAWHDSQNVSILGWYDLDHDLNISGVEASFYSDCNALLGEPRDHVTHQVLWAYNQNPNMAVDWDPELQRALVFNVAGTHFLRRYGASDSDPTTWSLLERLNHARNQTAWPGNSAEVTYFTMTTRRVDILAELNISLVYNVATHEKYRVDPATFSLGGQAPGTQLVPYRPPIAGWQKINPGGGLAQVVANIDTHAHPLKLIPDAGSAIIVRADPGTSTVSGDVSFWFYLEGVTSNLNMFLGAPEGPMALS